MPYQYPPNFPQTSSAAVKARWVQAKRSLTIAKEAVRTEDLEEFIRNFAIDVTIVFAGEALQLGRRGIWTVDFIDLQVKEFLRCLVAEEQYDRHGKRVGNLISQDYMAPQSQCPITRETWHEIEKNKDWQRYEDDLVEVSELQAKGGIDNSVNGPPEWMKPTDKPATPSGQLPGPDAKSTSDRMDEASLRADISHEEQADRIKISRTTYFAVKAGRGGRKSKRKVEDYLTRVLSVK